jgi:hypothetical protein
MNMPSKGEIVYVEGYGSAIYIGSDFSEDTDDKVGLKFEGIWEQNNLNKGYGRGIIWIDLDEWDENRVYPEQTADGEPVVKSTKKRDEILRDRFE